MADKDVPGDSSDDEKGEDDLLLPGATVNIGDGNIQTPPTVNEEAPEDFVISDSHHGNTPVKPSLCGCHWIICYLILGAVALLLLGGGCALYLIPHTSIAPVLVYVPDLVYIPLPKPTQFLTDVSLQSNGTCKGTLYQLPCDKVNVSYDPNYVPNYEHQYNPWDHIYCLNGSTFVFNTKEGHNETNKQVWIFTDFYAKRRHQANLGQKFDCNNPPPDSYCRQMVNGTASIPVILPKTMVGQYYYVLDDPSNTFHIKRYYYNYTAVDFDPYKIGTINSNTPLKVSLRKKFHPIDVHKSSMCMLMHVEHGNNNQYQYISITTYKRYDLLLWIGIMGIIDIIFIILLIFVHVIVKIHQYRKYERSRRDAETI